MAARQGGVYRKQSISSQKLRRPGDPARLVADATRAKNELSWKPQYDDLNQIIKTAWNWFLQHHPALAR